jgi:ankyrin repeat protein
MNKKLPLFSDPNFINTIRTYIKMKNWNIDDTKKVLRSACESNHINIIKYFIEEVKFNPNSIVDCRISSLINYACYFGSNDVVEYLIENGGNVNDNNDTEHNSLLHIAADAIDNKLIRLLIEKGADINKKNRNDVTPLHLLAEGYYEEEYNLMNWIDSIIYLIEMGTNIYSLDKNGHTPKYYAEKGGLISEYLKAEKVGVERYYKYNENIFKNLQNKCKIDVEFKFNNEKRIRIKDIFDKF